MLDPDTLLTLGEGVYTARRDGLEVVVFVPR